MKESSHRLARITLSVASLIGAAAAYGKYGPEHNPVGCIVYHRCTDFGGAAVRPDFPSGLQDSQQYMPITRTVADTFRANTRAAFDGLSALATNLGVTAPRIALEQPSLTDVFTCQNFDRRGKNPDPHTGAELVAASCVGKIVVSDLLAATSPQLAIEPGAAQVIVGHEYGHHLLAAAGMGITNERRSELQADCFSGAYLAMVNPGYEVDGEAMQAGMGRKQSDDPHGTSAERSAALRSGFTGANCFTYAG